MNPQYAIVICFETSKLLSFISHEIWWQVCVCVCVNNGYYNVTSGWSSFGSGLPNTIMELLQFAINISPAPAACCYNEDIKWEIVGNFVVPDEIEVEG